MTISQKYIHTDNFQMFPWLNHAIVKLALLTIEAMQISASQHVD